MAERSIRAELEDEGLELPWYKYYGGGEWEAEGERQLGFLRQAGMQPHHRMLDVGCGTLRGGVKLIAYLADGNYWGIDSNAEALEGAWEAVKECGLQAKQPHLIHLTDFTLESLGQRFDYYLAYSLFTELPLNSVIRCVMNIDRTLLPEARFYATFWENADGKFNLEPVPSAPPLITYFDQYPYHYDFGTFEWICKGTGLEVQYLGDWCGRGPQKVLVFTRK